MQAWLPLEWRESLRCTVSAVYLGAIIAGSLYCFSLLFQ